MNDTQTHSCHGPTDDRQLKDPVCGMGVTPRSPFSYKLLDKTYYFCSEHCLTQFTASFEKTSNHSTARDPVCGMNVSKDTVLRHRYNGEEYYFCSGPCLNKFARDPASYLKKATETPAAQPENKAAPSRGIYTCPMHPEVRQEGPGSCPKCGMALEPEGIPVPATKTEYTCPMHPEVVQDHPGNCPKCGMALEPRTVTLEEEENPELKNMTRRFWISAVLTIPLVIVAMGEFIPGVSFAGLASPRAMSWLELLLATPVVLWGGWPFFVRGWQSVVNRSLNMFTLIGLGTGVAYLYSTIAALFPEIFPPHSAIPTVRSLCILKPPRSSSL